MKPRNSPRYARTLFVFCVALAACGGSSDATGPTIDPGSLIGRWEGELRCSPTSPASLMYVTVPPSMIVAPNNVAGAGRWGFVTTQQEIGPWTGEIWTNGRPSTVKFWKQVLVAGGTFTGTLTSATELVGTWTEQGGAFSLNNSCGGPLTLRKVA